MIVLRVGREKFGKRRRRNGEQIRWCSAAFNSRKTGQRKGWRGEETYVFLFCTPFVFFVSHTLEHSRAIEHFTLRNYQVIRQTNKRYRIGFSNFGLTWTFICIFLCLEAIQVRPLDVHLDIRSPL